MTYNLFPYQQDLVHQAQQAYIDGYKAPCIVLGCGGGKSVIISEIIRQSTHKGNRVLFLVHRKELQEQIRNSLKNNEVIMDQVYVGMVQTVVRNLEKHPSYDLIVVDENHHTLAKSYRKILDYFDTYVLGFTATPIRLNGDGLGDVNDLLIEGVSVSWMIEHNRLSPYKYYTFPSIDTNKLKKNSTGDYSQKSMDDALGETIYGDVVSNYKERINNQKTILYAHNVKYSKKYAEVFNENGIPARHIDAKTPKQEREQIIEAFRSGEILVLCNVDILGEGFDVPDCTAVMLLRPTQSLSLHIQQSMRPMRYQPGKTATILDHVGNVFRHGLPDDKRTWSLKKKKRNEGVENIVTWLCDTAKMGCGMFFSEDDIPDKEWDSKAKKYYRQCPECLAKHYIEQEASGGKVFVDGLLQEFKRDELSRRDWRQASSYRELQEIGKARGYKPSWAAFKARDLGLPDAPKWVVNYQSKKKRNGFEFNFGNEIEKTFY